MFEETAFLLVSVDEIRADEQLSVQLWDSDKRSADDLVGRIENISLANLVSSPGKVFERSDTLLGYEDKDAMTGKLVWSVCFHNKVELKGRDEPKVRLLL